MVANGVYNVLFARIRSPMQCNVVTALSRVLHMQVPAFWGDLLSTEEHRKLRFSDRW